MRIGSNVSYHMCTKATWQDCESARGLNLPTNLLNVTKAFFFLRFLNVGYQRRRKKNYLQNKSLKLYITVSNRGAKHHFTGVVSRNLELPRDSLRPIKFLEKRRSN